VTNHLTADPHESSLQELCSFIALRRSNSVTGAVFPRQEDYC